jgi:hypothetical protein
MQTASCSRVKPSRHNTGSSCGAGTPMRCSRPRAQACHRAVSTLAPENRRGTPTRETCQHRKARSLFSAAPFHARNHGSDRAIEYLRRCSLLLVLHAARRSDRTAAALMRFHAPSLLQFMQALWLTSAKAGADSFSLTTLPHSATLA